MQIWDSGISRGEKTKKKRKRSKKETNTKQSGALCFFFVSSICIRVASRREPLATRESDRQERSGPTVLGPTKAIWPNQSRLGSNLAILGPKLGRTGPNLGPTWAQLAPNSGQLAPTYWAQLEPNWGPRWRNLGIFLWFVHFFIVKIC